MAHHAIFIPGLGDKRTFGQNIAIQVWRLFGLHPHYFALGWHEKEDFKIKMQRLLEFVDQLHAQGHIVCLVGASAGASAVINTYAASRTVQNVAYICGKINRVGAVRSQIYAQNPDFRESMELLQKNLTKLTPSDKKRLLNIYPYHDSVVPYADTRIADVSEVRLPGWSHAQGILSGIILGAPHIARFARK